jgi:hypothetical protein
MWTLNLIGPIPQCLHASPLSPHHTDLWHRFRPHPSIATHVDAPAAKGGVRRRHVFLVDLGLSIRPAADITARGLAPAAKASVISDMNLATDFGQGRVADTRMRRARLGHGRPREKYRSEKSED